MTGWRVGYLGASKIIAAACDKIQGQITSATCSIAQKATETAVSLDPSVIAPMREMFKKRRDTVLKLMGEIPGMKTNVPDGAFYVFPNVTYYFGKSYNGTKITNATDLCFFLLDNARVALVPGAAFGDDNHIRFSYAAAEDVLVKALGRMKESLALLK
jgi:aspartate aminotransferase